MSLFARLPSVFVHGQPSLSTAGDGEGGNHELCSKISGGEDQVSSIGFLTLHPTRGTGALQVPGRWSSLP